MPYKEVVEAAEKVRFNYMCRAYSVENKEGVHENEDRYFCEEHVNTAQHDQLELFIVGVMDGHDGALAADIVARDLPASVINMCLKKKTSVHDAHIVGCQDVENRMKKTDSSAGCCVNSCVMWGRYLWCSNLGDCRAVYIPLSSYTKSTMETGKFAWLSRDHRASKSYELTRVRSKGYDAPTVHGRIEGILEPTRTIGDLDVKASLPDDIISITPETRMVDVVVGGSTDTVHQGILIQGTDGLWDGLRGDEILEILKHRAPDIRAMQKYIDESTKKGDFDPEKDGIIEKLEGLAQALCDQCENKPDCTDDTTIVITMISCEEIA